MPNPSELERVEGEALELRQKVEAMKKAPIVVTMTRGPLTSEVTIDPLMFDLSRDPLRLIAEPAAAFISEMTRHGRG